MEIERKFLVEEPPGELAGLPGVPIRQGYLAIDEDAEVRLRDAGGEFTLTVKTGHGETRSESEVGLGQDDFDQLWVETDGRRIEKHRRKLELDSGLVAEVDTYAGLLEGVSVVEVEFDTTEAAESFWPPDWFGRELTGDRAWANQSLATSGLPEKKSQFRLREGEDPGSGICRVITARACQAAAEVRAAGRESDPARQVHEARKSLKKARSAIRLLRGVIDDAERKAANESCGAASRRLSGARDAEVKLATIDAVAGPAGSGEESGGTGAAPAWRRKLEEEASVHRRELTAEGLADVARQIESVARSFRGRELPGAGEAVADNLGRSYRRGRKAMKKARHGGGAVAFHSWRKRAKDLRYQLEILESRLPDSYHGTRKLVEDLADKLGDVHDLDVLAEDLAGRDVEPEAAKRLGELIDEAHDRLAGKCFELGRETYGVKPGRFTNRAAESLSDPA